MDVQDNIHKEYKDTGALWSMCWMNFWCSLYNSVYLFGFTSAGWDLLSFCYQHPEVWSTTHQCTGFLGDLRTECCLGCYA